MTEDGKNKCFLCTFFVGPVTYYEILNVVTIMLNNWRILSIFYSIPEVLLKLPAEEYSENGTDTKYDEIMW